MSICAAENCTKDGPYVKFDPRGLCRGHNCAASRWGVAKTLRESFEERVDKSAGPMGCWIWTAGQAGPYGSFRSHLAHRLAYEFAHGAIARGMEIDHTCHVCLCVNPLHLREATRKQNKENRKGAHGQSGVRGVSWHLGKWRACVVHNKKHIYLGRFDNIEEAGEAARLKRLELFTHNDVDRKVV